MEIETFLISMKNPSNYPIKSFSRLKKITTLIFKQSVALIVIIASLWYPYISSFSFTMKLTGKSSLCTEHVSM